MGGWIGIGDCIAIDTGIGARGDTCIGIEGCVGGHAMTLVVASALAMGAKVAVGRCIGAVASCVGTGFIAPLRLRVCIGMDGLALVVVSLLVLARVVMVALALAVAF